MPFKKARNRKPEKRVESEVLSMAHALGMDLDVIESKAVYSVRLKRYLRGSAPKGFCDLVGNDKYGNAVFIELKDPQSKTKLRPDQRSFLMRKIKLNCFAICTYSADHFRDLYEHWHSRYVYPDNDAHVTFLLEALPKPPVPRRKST